MIFPFQTQRYTTRLSAYEVTAKLRGSVGKPPRWFKRPPEPYLGTVGDERFRIYRNIRGRNSFLPILRGRVTGSPQGADIQVRFDVHPVVVGFSVVWITMVAVLTTAGESFIGVGFIAFFVVLFSIGFFPEARRAEQDLKELLPPAPEAALTLA